MGGKQGCIEEFVRLFDAHPEEGGDRPHDICTDKKPASNTSAPHWVVKRSEVVDMNKSSKVRQSVMVVVSLFVIAISGYSLFGPRGSLRQWFQPKESIGEVVSNVGIPDTFEFKPKTIQGSSMKLVLPPDRIPSIDKPIFVSADKARIADDAPVIGVSLNGETHAYSMYLLDAHEIVNDQFGDQAVATTW